MCPMLLIQDVYIDISGRLCRGYVKFVPNAIYCCDKTTGQKRIIRVSHLMRIENKFLGSKPGLRMTTKDGELFRFGQLNQVQLEEARIFMVVNWRKRLLKLDNLTKSWILEEPKPQESKKEEPDSSLKLKKPVIWPLRVKLPLFSAKYPSFQLHRHSTKAKKLQL